MKFATNKSPQDGDIRVRKVFAYFPIHGENHTYWLEEVVVEEQYDREGDIWLGTKVNQEKIKNF